MWLKSLVIFFVIIRSVVLSSYVDPEEIIVRRAIQKCTESPSRFSCFADKAASVLENYINSNVTLFDGIKLQRNGEPLNNLSDSRSLSPLARFTTTLYNFLDTHTVSLDLTDEGRSKKKKDNDEELDKATGGGGGGGGSLLGGLSGFGGSGGGGSGGGGSKGGMMSEVKYAKYAFMVLLGIFGLTGPIFMKTMAVIAAKALIASKAALIIVGSVALKKIFQKEHEKPVVKVHTIHEDEHEDEHDRVYQNQIPYSYYADYHKPA
ncbi:uncharacterized protein LOC123310797 [Coccinella septempunctata]|uniref:uncharacterized protein LOC123310797 n=1 Tax=Coccinella septempunctata TaxID=41139 RepID=UPI001D05C4A2|nr:uncharacterized protein LOC123310797 [Coccinella septempunctata]